VTGWVGSTVVPVFPPSLSGLRTVLLNITAPYFVRLKVAEPSAIVAPTAGGVGSDAAVVPAMVTTYFVPPANCSSCASATAVVLVRAARRNERPNPSFVEVTARLP
jgi:hypothetical protein